MGDRYEAQWTLLEGWLVRWLSPLLWKKKAHSWQLTRKLFSSPSPNLIKLAKPETLQHNTWSWFIQSSVSMAVKPCKAAYDAKVWKLLKEYSQILVVTADNVESNHLQTIRRNLNSHSVMLLGKNTMMRRSIQRDAHSSGNKAFLSLTPLLVVCNRSLCYTLNSFNFLIWILICRLIAGIFFSFYCVWMRMLIFLRLISQSGQRGVNFHQSWHERAQWRGCQVRGEVNSLPHIHKYHIKLFIVSHCYRIMRFLC